MRLEADAQMGSRPGNMSIPSALRAVSKPSGSEILATAPSRHWPKCGHYDQGLIVRVKLSPPRAELIYQPATRERDSQSGPTVRTRSAAS